MDKLKKHVIRLKAATKSTHWVDNMHFKHRLVISVYHALKEVDLIKQKLITPITLEEFLDKL